MSYRKDKRLLVQRTNLYRWHPGNRENGQYKRNHTQRTLTVRGPLHEETIYGRIDNPHTKEKSYVVRKPLSGLNYKQLASIIDPALRKAIYQYVEDNGGEGKMKEMFAKPVQIQLVPGGEFTWLETVRIDSGATADLPEVRPGAFVEPGNNYLMAIYEGQNAKGKTVRATKTVSFMEAVERARQGVTVYETTHEGLPLWMTLQQNDLLVLGIKTKAELEEMTRQEIFDKLYRVKKMSGSAIGLVRHNWSVGNPDYPKGNPAKGLHYTNDDQVAFLKSAGVLEAIKVDLKPDGTLTPATL